VQHTTVEGVKLLCLHSTAEVPVQARGLHRTASNGAEASRSISSKASARVFTPLIEGRLLATHGVRVAAFDMPGFGESEGADEATSSNAGYVMRLRGTDVLRQVVAILTSPQTPGANGVGASATNSKGGVDDTQQLFSQWPDFGSTAPSDRSGDAPDRPRVCLLGIGLGARVAFEFASRYPEQVAALVAINPLTPGKEVLERIRSRCMVIWDVDDRLQLAKSPHGAHYFKNLLGSAISRMLRWRSSQCSLEEFLGQLEFQRELLQLVDGAGAGAGRR
jgi:pimeloyl-ACP methyl ester carboxylesterase